MAVGPLAVAHLADQAFDACFQASMVLFKASRDARSPLRGVLISNRSSSAHSPVRRLRTMPPLNRRLAQVQSLHHPCLQGFPCLTSRMTGGHSVIRSA